MTQSLTEIQLAAALGISVRHLRGNLHQHCQGMARAQRRWASDEQRPAASCSSLARTVKRWKSTRARLASTSIPSDKTKKKALSEAGFCSIR